MCLVILNFVCGVEGRRLVVSGLPSCVVLPTEMQAQLGERAVTGVVSTAVSEEGSETHFEAFQVCKHFLKALLPTICSNVAGEGWSGHCS